VVGGEVARLKQVFRSLGDIPDKAGARPLSEPCCRTPALGTV